MFFPLRLMAKILQADCTCVSLLKIACEALANEVYFFQSFRNRIIGWLISGCNLLVIVLKLVFPI